MYRAKVNVGMETLAHYFQIVVIELVAHLYRFHSRIRYSIRFKK